MTHKSIEAEIAARRCAPEDVLRWVRPGMDIIVGAANGEPVAVIDAIEAAADSLDDVRLHQMIALRPRPYIEGERPNLRHVSWFLSPHTRARKGHISTRRVSPRRVHAPSRHQRRRHSSRG